MGHQMPEPQRLPAGHIRDDVRKARVRLLRARAVHRARQQQRLLEQLGSRPVLTLPAQRERGAP